MSTNRDKAAPTRREVSTLEGSEDQTRMQWPCDMAASAGFWRSSGSIAEDQKAKGGLGRRGREDG